MKPHRTLALCACLAAVPAAAAFEDPVELLDGCRWRDQTIAINGKPNQLLSYRYQDCDGNARPWRVEYVLEPDNVLNQSFDDFELEVARFWPLNGAKPSAAIASLANRSVEPEERDRCMVKFNLGNGFYEFRPTADYIKELSERDDEIETSCGEYGASVEVDHYWTVIDGVLLACLSISKETPVLFDPASFRYVNALKPGVVE